jgi:hypothetical protein
MGIVITNLSDAIEFSFSTDRKRRIAHGGIAQANARREIGSKTWMIKIILMDGDSFQFKYSDVSSPSTGDAHALTNLILVYNSGGSNRNVFYATAGQAVFSTTFVMGSNIDAYVAGVMQASGFTWTVGGSTVTFSTPFSGGEEVIIVNR